MTTDLLPVCMMNNDEIPQLYHTGKLKGHSYQSFSFTVVHINNIGEASLEGRVTTGLYVFRE